jgi:hypothetical protein
MFLPPLPRHRLQRASYHVPRDLHTPLFSSVSPQCGYALAATRAAAGTTEQGLVGCHLLGRLRGSSCVDTGKPCIHWYVARSPAPPDVAVGRLAKGQLAHERVPWKRDLRKALLNVSAAPSPLGVTL